MSVFLNLLKIDFGSFLLGKNKKKKTLVLGLLLILAALGFVFWFEYNILRFLIEFNSPSAGAFSFFLLISVIELFYPLMIGFLKGSSYLFEFKDHDLLFSLPISPRIILLEKISNLYLSNLLSSLIFVLPGIISYIILVNPSFIFYPIALLILVVFPMIPTIVGSLISIFLMWLSSKFKFAKIMYNIFYMIFMIAFVIACSLIGGFFQSIEDVNQVISIVNGIFSENNLFFKPFYWYANAMSNQSIVDALILIIINIVVFAAFVWVFTNFFQKLNTALKETPKATKKGLKEQKSSGVFVALLKKEFSFLFVNSTISINFILGPVMVLIAAIAGSISARNLIEKIQGSIPEIGAELGDSLVGVSDYQSVLSQFIALPTIGIIIILLYFVNLSPISAFSISLEGKSFWNSKMLPVPTSKIFLSKCLIHLILIIPVVSIAVIVLCLSFQLPLIAIVLILIAFSLDTIFTAIFGLCLNLRFPKMDWDQPVKIVKQSSVAFIMTFFRILFAALVIVAYVGCFFLHWISSFSLMDGTFQFLIVLFIVQMIGIFLAYLYLRKVGPKLYANIPA